MRAQTGRMYRYTVIPVAIFKKKMTAITVILLIFFLRIHTDLGGVDDALRILLRVSMTTRRFVTANGILAALTNYNAQNSDCASGQIWRRERKKRTKRKE